MRRLALSKDELTELVRLVLDPSKYELERLGGLFDFVAAMPGARVVEDEAGMKEPRP